MRAIRYYYDVPLPNEFSATIQILKTGRAFAATGRAFTFAARAPRVPVAALLEQLGLEPHPALRFATAFPNGPPVPPLRRLLARAAFLGRPPGSDGAVVMSRGESGFLVAAALGRRRGPFVYEMHRLAFLAEAERSLGRKVAPDAPLPATAARIRRVEARTIAAADALIFLTEAVREAVRDAFGFAVPSIVAPSGVDTGRETAEVEKDVDIVFLGKIERRKGVGLALQAMRHLPGRRLRLIGDGAGMPWARRLAGELGVAAQVEFAGRIAHAAVPAELARARVGICPLPQDVDHISERFTSPLKLLAMMAAGLPVVATDLPSVRAICTHRVEALLAPPGAPEPVAAAIREILADSALAARLSAGARTRASDFSWTARARAIARLLEAGRPGGADSPPGPGT